MPIDVHCPSCDQKLIVPDDLIGQGVQCQKCNTMFLAVEEPDLELIDEPPEAVASDTKPMAVADPVELELVDEPPGPVAPETKPMAVEEVPLELVDEPPEAGYRILEEPTRNNRKGGPARRVPNQSGQEAGADEGQNRRQQRRKRHGRPSAAGQLRLPALLLMIAGYSGAALTFLLIILGVIGGIVQASAAPVGAPKSSGIVNNVILAAVQLSVTAAWTTALIKGSQSMTSRRDYKSAIIGCVVAMAPCSCGCFLGLPIGIWGLVILLQEDVKKAFD